MYAYGIFDRWIGSRRAHTAQNKVYRYTQLVCIPADKLQPHKHTHTHSMRSVRSHIGTKFSPFKIVLQSIFFLLNADCEYALVFPYNYFMMFNSTWIDAKSNIRLLRSCSTDEFYSTRSLALNMYRH